MFRGRDRKAEEVRVVREASGGYRRNVTMSQNRRPFDEGSDRRKVHSLTDRRRKVGVIFGASLFVAIMLLVLLFQFIGSVAISSKNSDISKSYSVNETKYIEAVDSYFGGNPAQRLKFLLNENDLGAYVGAIQPEIQAATLSEGSSLGSANVMLDFRKPVAGWQIAGKQYYVDKEGVVFEHNYFPEPSVQIVDESGISPDSGEAVASGRLLGFVGKVVSLGQGRGYSAVKVVLPEDTTRRLDVEFDKMPGVAVRFSVDGGAGEQVSDAVRVMDHLLTESIGGVQYIDVRVSGRAVYK